MKKIVSKNDLIAIIGMGLTGASVANYLSEAGYPFVIWDDDPNKLEQYDCFASPDPDLYVQIGITKLILSPGVNQTTHRACKIANDNNIPIYSDFDIFIGEITGKIVLVTGTNGKSTTTSLIGHILASNGLEYAIGGNIGYPLCGLPKDKNYYIIEISSYQLEISKMLRSDISILLNITPDHLERHGGLEKYEKIKSRAFLNSDLCILNLDDTPSQGLYKQMNQPRIGFSATMRMYEHNTTSVGEYEPVLREVGSTELPQLPYRDIIPEENKIAAFIAAKNLGLSDNSILNAISTFNALNHRNQIIGKIGNVTFINDSKATNIDSTHKALQSCRSNNVFLILGGLAKTYNIDELIKSHLHIKKIFLVGASTDRFAEILSGKVAFEKSVTLDKAFISAYNSAKFLPKSVVLLSPACASFDQWKNFEERGNAFISMFSKIQST